MIKIDIKSLKHQQSCDYDVLDRHYHSITLPCFISYSNHHFSSYLIDSRFLCPSLEREFHESKVLLLYLKPLEYT